MSQTALILCGLVMLGGFAGIVIPALPGLLLMVGAALWWTIADGGGVGHWFVFVLICVLAAGGTVAKVTIPARRTADTGTPRSVLLLAFACAIAGFFVIPVIGAPIGFVAGVFAGEWQRLRDRGPAWEATKVALKGVALGALIEAAAATLILGTWIVGVQATGGDFGIL